MNNKQALKRLQLCLECGDCFICKDMEGAIDVSIESVNKQIPKMPDWCTESEVWEYKTGDKCPTCGKPLYYEDFGDYCKHCGQRIDWEGEA